MSYLIQLLLERLRMPYSSFDYEDDDEKYRDIWTNYTARINHRFTWLMVIFVGIPVIGLAFFLFLIDYPEPINISLFGIP